MSHCNFILNALIMLDTRQAGFYISLKYIYIKLKKDLLSAITKIVSYKLLKWCQNFLTRSIL